MSFILFIVAAWFIIGLGYAIAVIRHLDEYSAEWFIKYLRLDDQEYEFDSDEERQAVQSMTPKECLLYLRVLGFFGLLVAGPLGLTIAPYKEVIDDIKLWRTAGSLRRARELSKQE